MGGRKVPLLHVYGNADHAVPREENTGLLAERYRKLGGQIRLIAQKGVGHHPHGLDDPTPIVEFIAEHAAITSTAARAQGQAASSDDESRPYPRLATADTRADPQAIAALERPGKVFFRDDFDSPESLSIGRAGGRGRGQQRGSTFAFPTIPG